MKKIADILESDIDELIGKLVGSVPITEEGKDKPEAGKAESYQLPVRHTKGGAEIDDENKPWIIGTFIPGRRINPRHPHGHNGVDLAAPRGTPIYPIASGVVSKVRTLPKGGLTVNVDHEEGRVSSYYAHLDAIKVNVGDKVGPNTILGDMGDTGNARGTHPHLHYEVRVDGKHVDPQSITGKRLGSLSKKADFISGIFKKLDSLIDDRKSNFEDIVKNNNLE